MIINHNMSAHFVQRQLAGAGARMGDSIEKLSSGHRINKAGDDASGLAVSEKLRSQIRGIAQATRNAQNGISFLQTAEGSMQEMHSILHRMRELCGEHLPLPRYQSGGRRAEGRHQSAEVYGVRGLCGCVPHRSHQPHT